jgi:hypothetical protein
MLLEASKQLSKLSDKTVVMSQFPPSPIKKLDFTSTILDKEGSL